MKLLLQNNKTGELRVEEVPAPVVQPGRLIVRNRYSLVSAGTERATVGFARRSLLGKARSRPDLVRQVIRRARTTGLRETYRSVMARLDQFTPLGYSCAGEVLQAGDGVDSAAPGDLVACAGSGFANHAEIVSVPRNLVVRLPDGVSPAHGAFATLGAVALQGIRRAELTPGEGVVVVGLGLLGQLTVQILRAYGFPVLGLDIDPAKVEAAGKSGVERTAVIGRDDVEAAADAVSAGAGLDAAIITAATAASEPIELAGQLLRERGRVSVVGDVGLEIPRRVYYPKELDVRISRSYGPGRYDPSYEDHGVDFPLPYARWTEQRNMGEFLRLVAGGRVDVSALTTHTFPVDRAADAYRLVVDNPARENFFGVLLEYPLDSEPPSRRVNLAPRPARAPRPGAPRVGLIGAGGFARGTLIPALLAGARFHLRAVASASGSSARDAAQRHGAEYATSDYHEILDDDGIDLVVAAARHNLNSRIAVEALRAGKHVHVEKPLALTREGLSEIAEAANETGAILTVGFNRRFAPLAIELRRHFDGRGTPLFMHCRVNAGAIPPSHWVHDPVEGGGRILGEACHFVDLMQFLAGSPPVRAYGTRLPPAGETVLGDDNVLIALDFADGSRGSIVYSALGAPDQPKEYIEVMGGGRSAALDDFRELRLWGREGAKTRKGRQDKGHNAAFAALAGAINDGGPSPIPLKEALASSLATICAVESLQAAAPVAVRLEDLAPSDEAEDAGN